MTSVAIITCPTLGDGLLYMELAHNLQRHGYKVTVFSNMICQLKDWFPAVTLQRYPESESIYDEFDFRVADGKCYLTDVNAEQYPKLAKKYIFMKMAGFDERLVHDHNQGSNDVVTKLAGVVVSDYGDRQSMAERLKLVCEKVLGFKDATIENGLTPASDCKKNRYPRRVILHPESGNPIKNWSSAQYIELAKKLRASDFEPVFMGSPDERERWLSMLDGDFEMPRFASLSDAAQYLLESGLMVGNDSGIGHLASNLGLPTFTIHRKRDPHYRWRPGWGHNTLILPNVFLKFVAKENWRKCVGVNRVLSFCLSRR